jgi:hypothetical protein
MLLCRVAYGLTTDDLLDRVDDALTTSQFDSQVNARISGLLDMEAYHFSQPAPGLIDTQDHNYFNPRLTLFLDGQIGPHLYVFMESRVDRGFDPGEHSAEIRLDEYAVRYTPWDDGRLNVQIGQFATVAAPWVDRHLSWQNPFIDAPLPYSNLTPASDIAAPYSPGYFLAGKSSAANKYEHIPIIWGPDYSSGAAVTGHVDKLDYAVEIKNTALSARPEDWSITHTGFTHPAINSHIGFSPDEKWHFGLTGAEGDYLTDRAAPTLPAGRGIGDYHEYVLGEDASFAWRYLQIWAECYEARFEIPRVGDADTVAYYIELKYKLAAQLFGALRWNQQFYGTVPDGYGGSAPWGRDVSRADMALGYRFTAHSELKLQYSLQNASSGGAGWGYTLAAQFTVRF